MTLRRNRPAQHDSKINRRSGMLPGRRCGLGVAIAIVALSCAGGLAAADSTPTVATATIYHRGGGTTQDSVTLGALQSDPQDCPQYPKSTMATNGGSGSAGLPGSGPNQGTWTLAAVFHCMATPVAVRDVTGVTALYDDGSPELGASAQLTPKDLAAPSDFNDSSENPVISEKGPMTFSYDRPWRGGSDDNASDEVNSGSPIGLQVFEGPPLEVQISAAPASAATGAAISFSATVTGDPGSSLTYNWSFPDNLGSSTATGPTQTFSDAGSYSVSLQVVSADGGEGVGTLALTITSSGSQPPPSSGTTPTGPAAPTQPGGHNPKGGTHGNGNGHGNQHPSGPTGTKPPKPTSPTKSNSRSPTGSTPQASSHHGRATGRTTTSATTSTGAPASSSPPSSGPTSRPPAGQAPPHRPGRTTHRAPRSHRTASGQSTAPRVVTGLLISDVRPLPAGASPLVRSSPPSGSPATAPQGTPPDSSSPWAVTAAVLAILALLGLGARRELGGALALPRPTWPHRPRPGN